MRNIKDINVKGKRVLLRVDFNITFDEKKEISDDLRLRSVLPTINYLIEKGAKIILVSHFKEPEEKRVFGEENKEKAIEKENSLYLVAKRLSALLGEEVKFIGDCVGREVKKEIGKMERSDVLLLENLRMYKEEKENSEEFGKELASLGDIYVNDAFSVSHREHASVVRPPALLPSACGMLMEREIKILEKAQKNPKRPVIAIIGGAKVKSKITTVSYFIENADHVLLGGKIANTLLIVRGLAHNRDLPGEEVVSAIKDMDYTTPKLHLPVDVIASTTDSGESDVRETAVGNVKKEEDIFDIGAETIKLYGDIIREAGTIIWAGPLGLSERKAFEKGTQRVGEYIVGNGNALKVAGGGDTNKALKQFNLLDKIDHVSCGGGAMLTYIMKGSMPGIKALEK